MHAVKKFKKRHLSWSSLSSFAYDKEKWFQNYILGEKEPETEEMKFGKKIAKCIEDGTCEIVGLTDKLEKKKEHKFSVMFNDIHLLGFADAFCDQTFKKLNEVKTGKKAWDKKRVDEHGQLTMYCLMNYITNKIKPEEVDITLFWLPTKDNGDFSIEFMEPLKVHAFKTKRTMTDIVKFGLYIKETYQEMLQYIEKVSG